MPVSKYPAVRGWWVMKRRILSYRIPPGHRHTVIATIRSECCIEFVTYTGDYQMFHGLMGSESEPEIFCLLLPEPSNSTSRSMSLLLLERIVRSFA